MKKIVTTLFLASLMSLTGCTTIKGVFGTDKTGTHDVHAPINNKAPVSTLNGVLVDAEKQMTLYTYDKDTYNHSDCKTVCLTAWPAFLAPSAQTSGSYSTIKREDGKYQWTLNGRPLYFYAVDTKAGDIRGEAIPHWDVIKTK